MQSGVVISYKDPLVVTSYRDPLVAASYRAPLVVTNSGPTKIQKLGVVLSVSVQVSAGRGITMVLVHIALSRHVPIY